MLMIISPSKQMTEEAERSTNKPYFHNFLETISDGSELTEDQQTYEALDLYEGLQYRYLKEGLTNKDIDFLQETLRILSARYGVLKPLDGIRKYRKDFTAKGLYRAWGGRVYQRIAEEDQVILNLASNEFSKTISRYLEDSVKLIDVEFKERKEDGSLKKHSTISKKGRGQLVNYIARTHKLNLDHVKKFNDMGYEYQPELSDENKLVFIRPVES